MHVLICNNENQIKRGYQAINLRVGDMGGFRVQVSERGWMKEKGGGKLVFFN